MKVPNRIRTVRCPACGRLAEVPKGQTDCGEAACRVQLRRAAGAKRHRTTLGAAFAALTNSLTESGHDGNPDGGGIGGPDNGRPDTVDG